MAKRKNPMDDSLLSNPGMTLAGGLRQAMYGPDAPIEKRPASELPIRGPWTDQDQMKADIGHIARNTPGMGTYDNPTLLGTVQTGLSEIFVPLGGKLFSDYEANKPRVPRGERQSEYNAMPSAQPKPQTEQSSVATRKPEDLKSLQSRGLMPHDMSVARFVTMSDADYNGTIKENTVAKNDRYSAGGTEQYRTEGERDKKRGFTYYNNDGTPLSAQPVASNDVLMQPVPSTPMQTDLAQYDAGAMYRAAMAAEPPAAVSGMYGRSGFAGPLVADERYADRHPGMPASVANFDGAQIVRDAAAAHQAARVPQAAGPSASRTPTEGAYVPAGIKPAGGVRTGDPFLDVNTDFGALAADKAVKDANDAAFTQMNRGHMSGIAATREAANSDRNSRLQQMGKTPDEIERIMYPERFSDLRGEAMANVEGRAKPARMSQQAFDETNGRISATSRTDALMRKARLNGQNLPYAQAAGIARNDLPTTGPDTVGQASLPGMNPMRLAQSDPRAGQVAAMYGLGGQRNANDAVAEMGRQGLVRDAQGNTHTQAMAANAIAQQAQNTNDAVAKHALGSDPQQASALAFIRDPANQHVQFTDQGLWNAMRQRAMGGAAAPQPGTTPAPAAAPASAAPQSAAPAVQAGLPGYDAYLVRDPQAMQLHLAKFTDPLLRLREEARLYAQAGQSHPSIGQHATQWYDQNQPNLVDWLPDWGWLNDDHALAQSAADQYSQANGIPAAAALPYFRQKFD